jgi:hypothetical protein
MKTFLTTILLTCVIASSFSSPLPISRTKQKPIEINSKSIVFEFGAIFVHRQANGAALSWTVSDKSIVDGFYIQRSYDGTNFVMVGTLTAVSTAPWYRYFDNTAFPGFITYRIVAVLNDGTEVISPFQNIRIISKKG